MSLINPPTPFPQGPYDRIPVAIFETLPEAYDLRSDDEYVQVKFLNGSTRTYTWSGERLAEEPGQYKDHKIPVEYKITSLDKDYAEEWCTLEYNIEMNAYDLFHTYRNVESRTLPRIVSNSDATCVAISGSDRVIVDTHECGVYIRHQVPLSLPLAVTSKHVFILHISTIYVYAL